MQDPRKSPVLAAYLRWRCLEEPVGSRISFAIDVTQQVYSLMPGSYRVKTRDPRWQLNHGYIRGRRFPCRSAASPQLSEETRSISGHAMFLGDNTFRDISRHQ